MKLRKLARTLTVGLTLAYVPALVVVWLLLRLVGERWWATSVALYLPRWGWGLPILPLAAALLLWGPRRLLAALGVALAIVVFPLMGLEVPSFSSPPRAPNGMRVLSWNVATGRDIPGLVQVVKRVSPDILLMQEYAPALEQPLAEALPGFHRHTSTQFFLASRWPIKGVYEPPKLAIPGSPDRSARFVRYTVETPAGPVDVFNVHPVSPRNGLEELRGNGLREEIRSGRIFGGRALDTIRANANLRRVQVETFSRLARASTLPVIVAGDTNLPHLSWILGEHLGDFDDGFDHAGGGLGYTYPASKPWMRIDRILQRGPLRFTSFSVIADRHSDHLGVWADLAPR